MSTSGQKEYKWEYLVSEICSHFHQKSALKTKQQIYSDFNFSDISSILKQDISVNNPSTGKQLVPTCRAHFNEERMFFVFFYIRSKTKLMVSFMEMCAYFLDSIPYLVNISESKALFKKREKLLSRVLCLLHKNSNFIFFN